VTEDRILVTAQPLTDAERAERFNFSTSIKIESVSERWTIDRQWVRVNATADSGYGYAEHRGVSRNSESVFDLKIPANLDCVAMANAILAEVRRQSEDGLQPPKEKHK
jgi:hypothetical protein